MYRIGLIGCGSISNVHAQVLRELPCAELVACADIIPERAAKMGEAHGCAYYTDWERMLDAAQPDAVHICTPHYLHPEMVRAAAMRGIAAFTEKPPAIDALGWNAVKRASEAAPVGICFQNRYHPHIQACLRVLKEGTYGKLRGMRAFVTWNRTADYYAAADWKGRWATEGGGALINQAIHTLDLMIGFLGMPDVADATMSNHRLRGTIEVEDTAEVYLRRGDVSALLYASNAYSQDAPVLLELHLEGAVIRIEGDVMTVIEDGRKREITCQTDPVIGRAYWGAGHKACIADFYRCLEDGARFANDPAGCDATMRTLLHLYDQCREALR